MNWQKCLTGGSSAAAESVLGSTGAVAGCRAGRHCWHGSWQRWTRMRDDIGEVLKIMAAKKVIKQRPFSAELNLGDIIDKIWEIQSGISGTFTYGPVQGTKICWLKSRRLTADLPSILFRTLPRRSTSMPLCISWMKSGFPLNGRHPYRWNSRESACRGWNKQRNRSGIAICSMVERKNQ